MPEQLADATIWITPHLRQAWADYCVALHLCACDVEDGIRHGSPAYDVALSKFQQSAEKVIGALILAFSPQHSALIWRHHYLQRPALDDQAGWRDYQKVRRLLQSVLVARRDRNSIISTLAEVERLVPDASRRTVADGRVTAVALNSEYPYTTTTGVVVAPCDTGRRLFSALVRLRTNLQALFEAVAEREEFADACEAMGCPHQRPSPP